METSTRTIYSILRELINTTRHLLLKQSNDILKQDSLIDRSHLILQRFISIFHDGEKLMFNPQDSQSQTKLNEQTQQLIAILSSSADSNPSHRHFDDAMKKMSEYVFSLAGPFDRQSSSSLSPMHSDKLNQAADQLNQATTDLVKITGQGTIQDLARNSARFSQAFGDFLHNSLDYVHHQKEEEKRSQLIITLKNVHATSNQFLEQAKSVSVEPTLLEKNNKQHLAEAAR